MITYIKGNAITLAEKGNFVAFAHGCNCLCRMGRGIAKEVKERLQPMWLADVRTLPGDRSKLGTYTSAVFPWGVGYNLYTQFSHSDKDDMIDWDKVPGCFQCMFANMVTRKLTTLIIPKLCAGLARGHLSEKEAWNRVVDIIETNCPEGIQVIVVEYDGA
jgi:hypothetical protein